MHLFSTRIAGSDSDSDLFVCARKLGFYLHLCVDVDVDMPCFFFSRFSYEARRRRKTAQLVSVHMYVPYTTAYLCTHLL